VTNSADPESRIALLRSLAAESPGDPTTLFLLGRELASIGRAGEAVAAFSAAITADPHYTAAYRQLGNALEAAGRTDEAAAAYLAGAEVAERTHDLQAGKEMRAFLKRIERDRN
jgi:Flp pilus assembly protein TadD